MDVEVALTLANTLVFQKTGQDLNTLHAFIFRSAWLNQTYEEMTQTCRYSDTHLKKVGSALWELLSSGLDAEVNKKTFRAAIERYAQSRPEALDLQDAIAPIPMLRRTDASAHFPELLPIPVIEELQFPEGPVEVGSPFYIDFPNIEFCCYYAISKPGRLIRIKGTRHTGKTSLLARILNHAREQNYKTVALNLQLVDRKMLQDVDQFLQWFCARVTRGLQLPLKLEDHWDGVFGSKISCKDYFENYLLPQLDQPLVLALDELEAVFPYSETADHFFALLRAWYEEAKMNSIWQNLRLVLVHSTDVYIAEKMHQSSSINVGLPIQMPEFNVGQIETLAQRHELDWTIAQAKQLAQLVGGHPYLVRLALYHIVQDNLSLDELLRLAPTEAGFYNSHMQEILALLEGQTDLVNALKTLVVSADPVSLTLTETTKLKRMGLIKVNDNQATLRCELYRQYFSDHLLPKF
ncbi:AAA-like domain-containing protein [Leptolyngbya boryana CZ1]|uniref:AAA-like domain-containing protein n=1 Tax=Leptolyngbya boryana CZ1 TaxID=3060204 RepID=A0AA97AND8_LEPBY|nr:AAA-like domain-containing protein [Leptolyngbya boryana]WNZ43929.1 AAA-like domain-containing protein [Leptolyngbya boryana CZ1]